MPGHPRLSCRYTVVNELAALMKADYEKLTAVVKASGMTPQ
jgi:hypothetical protein